jgi:hypothetical protein
MPKGEQWINNLKREFAKRIRVKDRFGYWVRINHDGTYGENIFVHGFPGPEVMKYVIDIAKKTSPSHVIPSEELDRVLADAEEATTPEGLRRRKEERLRLEKQERQAKWDAISDADKALLIAWAEAEADADT